MSLDEVALPFVLISGCVYAFVSKQPKPGAYGDVELEREISKAEEGSGKCGKVERG